MPLITVDELKVHAVSAYEGHAVKWSFHIVWMSDGLTQHHHASERRFGKAT